MVLCHRTGVAARVAAAALVLAAIAVTVPGRADAADSFTYDDLGRLTSATYGVGVIVVYTYDDNGNVLTITTSYGGSGVEEEAATPLRFALGAATPNPGSGPRAIAFSIPEAGRVSLRVFDVAGRLTATLLDRALPAGRYESRLSPAGWAAGVYFYRLSLGERTLTGRMVLLR
jgi:YD repeat-containing protein